MPGGQSDASCDSLVPRDMSLLVWESRDVPVGYKMQLDSPKGRTRAFGGDWNDNFERQGC